MTSASAVSAALRRAGFNPLGSGTSRSREGLRVSRSYSAVRVVADLDSEREALALAMAARSALRERGYSINAELDNPSAFYVS